MGSCPDTDIDPEFLYSNYYPAQSSENISKSFYVRSFVSLIFRLYYIDISFFYSINSSFYRCVPVPYS